MPRTRPTGRPRTRSWAGRATTSTPSRTSGPSSPTGSCSTATAGSPASIRTSASATLTRWGSAPCRTDHQERRERRPDSEGSSGRCEVQQERPEPALRGVLVRAVARVQDRRRVRPPQRSTLYVGDGGLPVVAGALAPQLGARVRLQEELRLRGRPAGRGRRRRHQPRPGPEHVRRQQRPAGAGAVRRHRLRQDPRPGLRTGGHQPAGRAVPSSTGAASRSASTRPRPTSAGSRGSPRRSTCVPCPASDRRSGSPRTASPIPAAGAARYSTSRFYRALTTFQFSSRLLFRNISEYNTLDGTLDLNFLLTYRVNAGTVFYAGYDDHYQQSDLIRGDLLDWHEVGGRPPDPTWRQRTNRAVFLKFQYLFRY